jgi:chitodextrinase
MRRANAYAADSHPGLSPAELQERITWLFTQCEENRAAEALAEEHGSMAPELFPNTSDDRHAHPLHCMALGDSRFGRSTGWRSWSEVDPKLPGGAAALNIPGDFMYAWIDGKPRFMIRYVVWTIDDRNDNPVSPVRIMQHPTENNTPQVSVATLHFQEAYQPTSVWVEMPDSIDWANRINDRTLPGRSFATRTWLESHCHDKRYPTNIPQMVIDRVKDLGWLDPAATPNSPRAIRFVANGDPSLAASWSLAEEPVTLPSFIRSGGDGNAYRWFYDADVSYQSDDVTPPSRPVALVAEARSATRVRLSWGAASDDVGVVAYRVFANGVWVRSTSNLSVLVRGLLPETEYRFKVYAVDAAGNVSPRSRIARATTFADTSRPSRPKNTTVTASVDSIFIDWDPATDNVGISHYWVKIAGVVSGTTTDTSWVVRGLEPGTEYTVVVRAVDTSGNRSRRVLRQITTLSATDSYDPIAAGHVWRYLDDGSDLGSTWTGPGFDDAGWASGVAELGYGDGDETTRVNDGPNNNRYITTYFRTDFETLDASAVSGLRLRLIRDDGAVVYINGVEVYRNNMPAGPIDSETRAVNVIAGEAESGWILVSLPTGALVDGSNVMAVEIHQESNTSSDISFNAQLTVNP